MTDDHQDNIREPLTEITETEDGATLTAELPGVPQDSIKMAVSGDILKLNAEGSRNIFSTIQALPFEPDPDRISVTFSQGVLEVVLKRRKSGDEKVKVENQETSMSISLGSMEKELERLNDELLKVSEERTALEDRFNFLRRDFQNIKRRHETEKEAFADRKIEEIAMDLVEVLDSFRFAKESISSMNSEGKKLDPVIKGVEMVEKRVHSLFDKIGIQRILSVGEHFDPNLHESIGQVSRDDMEDDMVAEEVRAGFIYRERALRPSQVLVNRRNEKRTRSKKVGK